ncbi:MAG: hypothetical protein Q8K86_08305 [Candidatus Nanopelagicaceae bacterium]|nr:hypothetical protein [Candidatus Nanopelagicaceae bacterium]
MMDYSLNLALKVTLDKPSVSGALKTTEKQFEQAGKMFSQKYLRAADYVAREIPRKLGGKSIDIKLNAGEDEFKESLDKALKTGRTMDVGVSVESWAQISAAARQLGMISREKMFDPASIGPYISQQKKLEGILGIQQESGVLLESQYESLANQVVWFKTVSREAYTDLTNGIEKSIQSYEKFKKEKPFTLIPRDSLKAMRTQLEQYIKVHEVAADVLGLNEKQRDVLNAQINLLEKRIEKEEKTQKIVAGTKRILDAMGLQSLTKMFVAGGLAEAALGLVAGAWRGLIGMQERFHTANMRMYGSMQELQSSVMQSGIAMNVTSEEAEKAYQAVAATGVPRDKLRQLSEETMVFNRVTGVGEEVSAQFQRRLLSATGSTTAATENMAAMVAQMKAAGLTGHDLTQVMSVMSDQAILIKMGYGAEGITKFTKAFGLAVAAAKQFGEKAVNGTIELGRRLAKGGLDEGLMMFWGADVAAQKDAGVAWEMMAKKAKGKLELLNKMSKFQRQAYLEMAPPDTESVAKAQAKLWEDAEAAAKKHGTTASIEYQKMYQKQAKSDEEKKVSDANAARQWDLTKNLGMKTLGVLMEPLSQLATVFAPILRGLATLIGWFNTLTNKLGIIGTLIKAVFAVAIINAAAKSLLGYKSALGSIVGQLKGIKAGKGIIGGTLGVTKGIYETLTGKGGAGEKGIVARLKTAIGFGKAAAGAECVNVCGGTSGGEAQGPGYKGEVRLADEASKVSKGWFGKLFSSQKLEASGLSKKLGLKKIVEFDIVKPFRWAAEGLKRFKSAEFLKATAGAKGLTGKLAGLALKFPILGKALGGLGSVVGALGPAALVAGAALAGWKIGSMIADWWFDDAWYKKKIASHKAQQEADYKAQTDHMEKVAGIPYKQIEQEDKMLLVWNNMRAGHTKDAEAAAKQAGVSISEAMAFGEKKAAETAKKTGKSLEEAYKFPIGEATKAAEKAANKAAGKVAEASTAIDPVHKALGSTAFVRRAGEIGQMQNADAEKAAQAEGFKSYEEYARAMSDASIAAKGREAEVAEMSLKDVLKTLNTVSTEPAVLKVGSIKPMTREGLTEPYKTEASPITSVKTVGAGREEPRKGDILILEAIRDVLTGIDGKIKLDPLQDMVALMRNDERTRGISQAGLSAEANQWHQSR